MDGVFMKKLMKRVGFLAMLAAFFWSGALLADREKLNENLIRFHVVANSDSEADQAVKLRVRDAVIAGIGKDLEKVADVEEARVYLLKSLPKIQQIANETLIAAGFEPDAAVSLCREAFDTRYYGTFSLPAGVYEELRITIGEGAGHNWWCVTFPALCIPATTDGFEAEAAGAGFSDTLTDTLTGEKHYEVRFFFLDALGKLENMFFAG